MEGKRKLHGMENLPKITVPNPLVATENASKIDTWKQIMIANIFDSEVAKSVIKEEVELNDVEVFARGIMSPAVVLTQENVESGSQASLDFLRKYKETMLRATSNLYNLLSKDAVSRIAVMCKLDNVELVGAMSFASLIKAIRDHLIADSNDIPTIQDHKTLSNFMNPKMFNDWSIEEQVPNMIVLRNMVNQCLPNLVNIDTSSGTIIPVIDNIKLVNRGIAKPPTDFVNASPDSDIEIAMMVKRKNLNINLADIENENQSIGQDESSGDMLSINFVENDKFIKISVSDSMTTGIIHDLNSSIEDNKKASLRIIENALNDQSSFPQDPFVYSQKMRVYIKSENEASTSNQSIFNTESGEKSGEQDIVTKRSRTESSIKTNVVNGKVTLSETVRLQATSADYIKKHNKQEFTMEKGTVKQCDYCAQMAKSNTKRHYRTDHFPLLCFRNPYSPYFRWTEKPNNKK